MFNIQTVRKLKHQLKKKDLIMASLNQKIDTLTKAVQNLIDHPAVLSAPDVTPLVTKLQTAVDQLQSEVGDDETKSEDSATSTDSNSANNTNSSNTASS